MSARAPSHIDRIIGEVAVSQLGLVTSNQVAASGLSPSALTRRQDSGMLQRLFPGVYRLTAYPAVPHQRALAAALAIPGASIAGPSAASIHGFPLPRTDEHEFRPVLLVPGSVVVRVPGVRVRRTTQHFPSRPWMGVRVSTPAATLVLLPRFVHLSAVERCLDHCLAHRLVSIPTLRSLIDSLVPAAVVGRAGLIELIECRGDRARHRSGLEQRIARWLRRAGLAGWTANLCVATSVGLVEVDFGWPLDRVALEISPFFTHGSRAKQDRDIERRRALVEAGWKVVEATDRDLDNLAAFAHTVDLLRGLLVSCAIPSPGR